MPSGSGTCWNRTRPGRVDCDKRSGLAQSLPACQPILNKEAIRAASAVLDTASSALGMALVATLVVKAQTTPANPPVAWRASQGLDVSPLNATEPISMAQAEASVPASGKTAPMVAELVMVSFPETTVPDSLGKPQPA